jgi:hypothetical protein
MGLSLTNSIPPGSVMPPGGHPRDDAALWEWAGAYATSVNTRWLDLHTGRPGIELPGRELMTSWQLIFHLYRVLVGWDWPDGTGPSRAHRIRFVAIQLRLRRDEVVGLARQYARDLYEKAITDGGGTED